MVNVSVLMHVDGNDYKQSLDSVLNQTLEGIEIICIDERDIVDVKADNINVIKKDDEINEINGEYFYFLKPGDILNKTSLREFFEFSKRNNLDFLQITDEDKYTGEIYSFDDFKSKAFNMDMTRYTKLFKTEFIKQIISINDDDYLFFWDCIFKAKRFAFLENSIEFKSETLSYNQSVDLIDTTNKLFTKFTDYEKIGGYKSFLFDWKLETLYKAYKNLEEKHDYYNELRKDFTQMIYHWRFTDFATYVKPINKLFFNDIVYSKDFKEFKKLMVQYELARDSEEIKKENEIIKKNIGIFQKENELILNSTSWKITKPLRGLK